MRNPRKIIGSEEFLKNDKKTQKRILKNRESAQKARENKKFYIQNLEENLNMLKLTNLKLLAKITSLEEELYILREQLEKVFYVDN